MNQFDTSTQNQEGPVLNKESLYHLNETRKWALFLSIAGFSMIAMMFIMLFAFNSMFSRMSYEVDMPNFPMSIFSVVYGIMGFILFFPFYFLLRFALFTKKAIQNNNEAELSIALKNLRMHYQFIGILTIISLFFTLLGMFGMFSASSMMGF